MTHIITTHNIEKKFGNYTALNNVSINVKEGSIFGLLGPNGAGKTTLLRILNQIIAPDKGTVFFRNEKLSEQHNKLIGYLPEERGLYKKMKVEEQGLYLAQLKGIPKDTAKKRLNYWLEKFQIEHWKNKTIEELSKGMQQKIQFILTVIHKPILYILDEPFSGFDPINAELIKQEILNFKKEGITIILSTHNMSTVEDLCDDIVLINKSKIVLEGDVFEIKQKYKQNILEIQISNLKEDITNILPQDFKILKTTQKESFSIIQIQIPSQYDTNELIKILMQHCKIHSIKEIVPSLNEIFISVVNENQNFSSIENIKANQVLTE